MFALNLIVSLVVLADYGESQGRMRKIKPNYVVLLNTSFEKPAIYEDYATYRLNFSLPGYEITAWRPFDYSRSRGGGTIELFPPLPGENMAVALKSGYSDALKMNVVIYGQPKYVPGLGGTT